MRIKERFLKVTAGHVIAGQNVSGIATIASGTAVASVSASNVKSGDVILLQPIQYTPAGTTVASGSQFFVGVMPMSVRTGAFEIICVGSRNPAGTMPVGWVAIHRS